MKTNSYLLFGFLFCLSFFSNAQRAEFFPLDLSISANYENNTYKIQFTEEVPFYTVCLNLDDSDSELSDYLIRFSINGNQWEEWKSFQKDIHGDENNKISNLLYADAEQKYYQIQNIKNGNKNIRLDLFNPAISNVSSYSNAVQREDCKHPPFKNRKDWCTTCTPGGSTITTVTHLVVHHSAGVNESSDWDAVVRGIWNYHVNSRGWDDIGYNWLVAPNGTLYEGRKDNIQGAHYCGKNGHTMGTCMMGNYMEIPAKDTAMATLIKLLAWKADVNNIDPLGSSYHPATGGNLKNIIGHRDGCATSCPGDKFYPVLHNFVKPAVNDLVSNKCKYEIDNDPDPDPDPDPVETYYKGSFKMQPTLVKNKIKFFSGRKIIHPITIHIINMTGQVVMTKTYSGKYDYFEKDLNVAYLPAGVYHVKVIYGRNEKEFKFAKY